MPKAMTSKERVLNTLARREPDRVPINLRFLADLPHKRQRPAWMLNESHALTKGILV